MTTDTTPTPLVRAAAHRRRPELPLWIRLTRPLLLAALAIAAGVAVSALGMLVVVVLGAAIAAFGR